MPAKTWTVDAPDGAHTIAVEQGSWLRRRRVTVDGAKPSVAMRRQWWKETTIETFPVGVETAELLTEPRGFAQWHHALRVGEREIVPRLPKIALPAWVSWPVFGCFGPFLLAFGYGAPTAGIALAGLMGGGGSAACLAFARDPIATSASRQRSCLWTVLFVWAMLALPSVALSALFALLHVG